jgi:hypothetical protein
MKSILNKEMKFDKAWPPEPKANSVQDAPVFPKLLIEQTVESTVNGLLKETFGETQDDQKNNFKAFAGPSAVASAGPSQNVSGVSADAIKHVWLAFGILAFFTFIFLTSLYQRISSLEAWLHGRLATRT